MKRVLKLSIPLVLFAYLVGKVVADWSVVSTYLGDASVVPLVLSFFILLCVFPEGAFSWHKILTALGGKVRFTKSFSIWMISNTSRYIPGTVWQYLGRIELAREVGVKRGITVTSLVVEVFLMLLSGVLIGIFMTAPFTAVTGIDLPYWILLAPFAFLVFHPTVINFLLGVIARVSRRDISKVDFTLGVRQLLAITPWFLTNFVLCGLALWLLLQGFGIEQSPNVIVSIGMYSLSWAIGFVSIIAPGGLGVVETSRALLLSSFMPLPVASAVSLLYRALISIAELLVFSLMVRLHYAKR